MDLANLPQPQPEARPVSVVKVEMSCPGYRSEVSFPMDTDAKEAFVAWFEMQLAYLARWKPGSTADLRETIPTEQLGRTP